ncbi:hypothetical protein F5X99DRAFT_420805 [Biscogniauxia marginata]|nr:hypothetical protein F5X99DRAFT_420805 [Biscogniauxia marginata]
MDFSSAPATSQAGKRKLEDAFGDIMTPPTKRLCSLASPSAYGPQQEQPLLPSLGSPAATAETQAQHAQPQHHEERPGSSPLSTLNTSSVLGEDEITHIQAQRTEQGQHETEGRDETEIQAQIDDAQGEIKKKIASIKSLTPDGAMDDNTVNLLIDEITEHSAKRGLINTPEEAAAMQNPTSPAIPSSASATAGISYVDASTSASDNYSNPIATIVHPDGYIFGLRPADEVCYMNASVGTSDDEAGSKKYVTRDTQTKSTKYRDVGLQTNPVSDLELWKRELEGIRRPEPLMHPGETGVITVTTKLRQQPSGPEAPIFTSQPYSSHAGPSKTQSSSTSSKKTRTPLTRASPTDLDTVIDLLDGDSEDASSTRSYSRMAPGDVARAPQQRGPPREEPSFYSISGLPSRESNALLRYQDRVQSVGYIPSPRHGLRLNLEEYLDDVMFEHRKNVPFHIKHTLRQSSWSYHTYDDDKSIRQNWTTPYLVKGFPLVEDVTFLINENYARPNGDCYWRALSSSLYGHDRHWDLVKAEHLGYLYVVLTSTRHPRHELYSETLNAKFFLTSSTAEVGSFRANIWQLLHMPHAWTPGAMQQITADLYNIHLVTFSYDPRRQIRGEVSCDEVSARGAYNARHVFMLYHDNNHFQPMTPNEHLGWEFRYPRITVANTARFYNAPRPGSRRVDSSRKHPWRNDFTREVPPPVPRTHGCDAEKLRGFMGASERY